MAKEYKVGERYYLPVAISSIDPGYQYPIELVFVDCGGRDTTDTVLISDEPDLLLTAEEIYASRKMADEIDHIEDMLDYGRQKYDEIAELKAKVAKLEAENATLAAELEKEKANTNVWVNTAEERGRLISGLKESLHEASEENSANDEALAQTNIKRAELEAENKKLKQQLADANELLSDAQAQVKELTEADCMRLQEFKPILDERDRLKAEVATRTENVKNLVEENDRLKKLLNSKEEGMRKIEEYADQLKKIADDLGDENEKLKAENDQEKKRTQVWKDSSEEHRQRAEELGADVNRYEMDIADNEAKIQRLGQENDSLKADILELKAQINAFRPDPKESEELKKRINMLEKLKFSHIKVIQGLTRRLKEKDFMISALVKKGIELEEGGESNG